MLMTLALLMVFIQNETEVKRVDASTPRDLQARLARSAGPAEVSAHASVYVLGPKGYEKYQEGTNGFNCLVERERVDTMEPECYDAEGSKTTLKVRIFVEEERSKGRTEDQIQSAVKAGYKTGIFCAPAKSGIVYMLSNYNHVFDPQSRQVIHFPGHLMFYAPYATEKEIGSGSGAPYIVHPGEPDALLIVVPQVSHDH